MRRLSGPPHPKPRILVTGGPTRAYLDEVRFLSNISTGALAYELCQQLRRRGAEVFAVIGPTPLPFEKLGLKKLVRVETNEEMLQAVLTACRVYRPDSAVFSAAVLDFVPARPRQGKVPTRDGDWVVKLKPSPKIIDEVGRKYPSIHRVGFKLEWKSHGRAAAEAFGKKVLSAKGLRGLCLNYLSDLKDRSHPALLFSDDGKITKVSTKRAIAAWIADLTSGG